MSNVIHIKLLLVIAALLAALLTFFTHMEHKANETKHQAEHYQPEPVNPGNFALPKDKLPR